jgi:hypothetical protein
MTQGNPWFPRGDLSFKVLRNVNGAGKAGPSI